MPPELGTHGQVAGCEEGRGAGVKVGEGRIATKRALPLSRFLVDPLSYTPELTTIYSCLSGGGGLEGGATCMQQRRTASGSQGQLQLAGQVEQQLQ